MGQVISFTGLSGSGKSAIAKNIAQDLGYSYVSINEIMHKLATSEHLISAIEYVRRHGEKEAIGLTSKIALRTINESANKGIVLDGLYDPNLAITLKENFGSRALILCVHVPEEIRIRRISERQNISEEGAISFCQKRDEFKINAGLEKVMEFADISISNSGNLLEAVVRCKAYAGLMRR